jgi:2',3'-cyclic-nucleotide 2'-phosphodiesterase (5'-nucleotidase family)
MFPSASLAAPAAMKVSDMFTLMPYENSLVVLEMNGPQLKAVLERAYRNYYYYKYVPGYGGYSYYTTCMIDTNFGNQIVYNDLYPALPNGNNVVSLVIGGKEIDFTDAATSYHVSTVNYLAAGSCNFNDSGVSLWPLNQIVNDTQYYVRDAVIDYATAMGTVSPAIEGRLNFINDTAGPVITITSPVANKDYLHTDSLTFNFGATDMPAGVKKIEAKLDGSLVNNGQSLDLFILALGEHTFTVNAWDKAGNQSTQSVKFSVIATVPSLQASVTRFYTESKITNSGTYNAMLKTLKTAQDSVAKGKTSATISKLQDFIALVQSVSGKQITTDAANQLIADAQWVIAHLK